MCLGFSLIAPCKGDWYWRGNGLVVGHSSRTVAESDMWRPDGPWGCWYFELLDGAVVGAACFPMVLLDIHPSVRQQDG